MNKQKKNKFSLYSWLLKKLCKGLIAWYFFTFLSSFFYYQAIFGLRTWNYQKPPYSLFFGTINFNNRESLLWYSFFCFFFGFVLTGSVCEYFKYYCGELCRFNLRKLLFSCSAKNPSQNQMHSKEIMSNFFGEVELFTPLFILPPQKIFAALVNITLNFIFLTNFRGDNYAIYFVVIISLILIFFSFFAYQIQKEINQKQNRFRQQENLALEKYLEKKIKPEEVKKLIDANFQKTCLSLKKKTLSYLPTFIIYGLNILFCLIYCYHKNWKIKEFTVVFIIATSIQNIFWKVKDITDTLPEISKIRLHYKPLKKIIKKLT